VSSECINCQLSLSHVYVVHKITNSILFSADACELRIRNGFQKSVCGRMFGKTLYKCLESDQVYVIVDEHHPQPGEVSSRCNNDPAFYQVNTL
jgi:hypothetical protein